jgi:predicted nucleic acid-binding protein
MRTIFADTSYWVALIDARDQWHEKSTALSKSIGDQSLVTTDEVLTEVLAFFSAYSPKTWQRVVRFVLDLMNNSTEVDVAAQGRASFLAGLALYEQRPDKAYSLVDCISMQLMKAEGLTDALTTDGHFTQEGFTILLKEQTS